MITFFLPRFDKSSADHIVVRLANEVAARGVRVEFLIASGSDDSPVQFHAGVTVARIEAKGVLSALPGVTSIFEKFVRRLLFQH